MWIYADDVYEFSIVSKGAYAIYFVFYMTLCWISMRGTKIAAGRSRHSVSFYDWNPQAKSLAGRLCHLVSFLNWNAQVGGFRLRSHHFTSFFGQKSDFRAVEGEEGRATLGRKRNPMCFQPTKGRSTRAKHEKHARNMRVFPAADDTAPAPFSPSLMGLALFKFMPRLRSTNFRARGGATFETWFRVGLNDSERTVRDLEICGLERYTWYETRKCSP